LNTFLYPIRALLFFDDTTGLAVGGDLYEEAGGIYSTTDGGTSWNLDENTNAEMFSLEMKKGSNDSTFLWCAGSTGGSTGFTGKVYKASIGKLATQVHNINVESSNGVELLQNKPNPFSTITQISFKIPVAGHASLKVYDILGNEVAILVNGFEMQGNKMVQFDASGLARGMYYYRLQTGDHTESKKLVLQ
jgi:hypothetical protein